MPLPKIQPDLFRGLLAGYKKGAGKKLTKERMEILEIENPLICSWIKGVHKRTDLSEEFRIAFAGGAIAMYFLLRSQAESDDLREQWGK